MSKDLQRYFFISSYSVRCYYYYKLGKRVYTLDLKVNP